MGPIEQEARMLAHERAIFIWVGFVAGLREAMVTYNASHRDHPARITQQSDKTIVVQGRIFRCPDDIFQVRTISMSARLIQDQLVINCVIQSWGPPFPGQPFTIDSEKAIDFAIEGEVLKLDKRVLTPPQAAEHVLDQALLKQ
jgi:hypothetical protein